MEGSLAGTRSEIYGGMQDMRKEGVCIVVRQMRTGSVLLMELSGE